MNSPILNIGSTYVLKYPKSTELFVCKLISKHEATLSHETLYTFTDRFGNKVIITNGLHKSIIIRDYEQPLTIIEKIDVPLPPQNNNDLIVILEHDL